MRTLRHAQMKILVSGRCRYRNGKWMKNLLSLLNADLFVNACENFFSVCVQELIV